MTVEIRKGTAGVLADVVRYHRKQSGLSRVALAELAAVGKTVIYDIEHGKQTVRLATLVQVLEALNIAVVLTSPLMDAFEEDRRETR